MRTEDALTAMVDPLVSAMGYELVGLIYRPNKKYSLLRIYIDKPEGIDVEDCEHVSHQVSGMLDVEDPIPGQYTLEVSSPGLDRPLFKRADFERFAGRHVRIRLRGNVEGRSKVSGILRGLVDDCVVVDEDGREISIPLNQLDKANLVPML